MDDLSGFAVTPLDSELIDGISEAVLWSRDRSGRSVAIRSIVEEICESIAWLHQSAAAEDCEMASLRQLLAEAEAHQERMHAGRTVDVVAELSV